MKECGINIDYETAKKNLFKLSRDKKLCQKHEFTDFNNGRIALEDICFLPENTYGILKQKNKKDILCKVTYTQPLMKEESSLLYETYLVNPFFDKSKNENEFFIPESWKIQKCHKSLRFHDKSNEDSYFQIVQISANDLNQWKPVKIKNCQDSLYWYQCGWQFIDGSIYKDKDVNSEKISLVHKIDVGEIKEEEFDETIRKVKPDVLLVPGEKENYCICGILYVATCLLNYFWILWIAITVYMFVKRKELRRKYWL